MDRTPAKLATVGSDSSFVRILGCWPLNVPTLSFADELLVLAPGMTQQIAKSL